MANTPRRPLVAGNWKMNGLRASLPELSAIIEGGRGLPRVDLMVCPPATLLAMFADAARNSRVTIGAQDCESEPKGASRERRTERSEPKGASREERQNGASPHETDRLQREHEADPPGDHNGVGRPERREEGDARRVCGDRRRPPDHSNRCRRRYRPFDVGPCRRRSQRGRTRSRVRGARRDTCPRPRFGSGATPRSRRRSDRSPRSRRGSSRCAWRAPSGRSRTRR